MRKLTGFANLKAAVSYIQNTVSLQELLELNSDIQFYAK